MDLKNLSFRYQPLNDDGSAHVDGSNTRSKRMESRKTSSKSTDAILSDGTENDMQKKGLGVWKASFFIIGSICGTGAVAFPYALTKSGLSGLVVIVLVASMCTYCGLLLSQSWMKIMETKPFLGPVRDPFPCIAEIAVGKPLRHAVTITLTLQMILSAVVYLIITSGILSSFVSFHIGDVQSQSQTDLRIWMLIVAIAIFPFLLFGTPKDFWFVALAALSSTTIALILVWVKYHFVAVENAGKPVSNANVTITSVASAFGTFVFGFAGSNLFPTLQADMKKPGNFPYAVYFGFFGIALLYIPTSIGGYFTFGKNMKASVIETLSDYDRTHNTNRTLVSIAEILFASHFLAGFVVVINPPLQQLEEWFNIPHEFSWKRVAVRGTVLVGLLTIAEIFPRFGPILDLVGGSLAVMTCFIFPVWCYLKLFPDRKLIEKMILALICIIAVLAGIASTASNLVNIINMFHQLYASNATVNARVNNSRVI